MESDSQNVPWLPMLHFVFGPETKETYEDMTEDEAQQLKDAYTTSRIQTAEYERLERQGQGPTRLED